MDRWYRLTLQSVLGVLLSAWLVACGTPAADSGTITSDKAHEFVAAGATLLDVRTEAEWSRGHLPGAVLVPVDELAARLGEIPRDKPVVVYCAAGGRSAPATRELRKAGYDAHDLGGMGRW